MMKKSILLISFALLCTTLSAQWKPAGDKIMTTWGEKLDPQKVLPEYPRPQMERSEWLNLNGLWQYAIRPDKSIEPAQFDGEILVPFAVESALSGVGKRVGESNELWYKTTFSVPKKWGKKDVLLHFGAIDWRADIFINDLLVESHEGGFTPFSINVTPYLVKGQAQKLVVRVWDPTNRGYQPYGKQSIVSGRIVYTPVTGIWQTVWLEPVEKTHIAGIRNLADIDRDVLETTVNVENDAADVVVETLLLEGDRQVAVAKGKAGRPLRMAVHQPKLWSPDSPFLYDMQVNLWKNGKLIDQVKSYTAFRKISTRKDNHAIFRLMLNNKPLFHFGPLDQGWWPDGLYTAPTDEALKFDIVKTKEWGYNMIRKHVKVEPARWYYYCDKLGMLVWQDMPSGDGGNYWDRNDQQVKSSVWAPYSYEGAVDRPRTDVSKANYYKEWGEIMDFCYPFPSVVMWIPFNEAWGQFDTEKVAEWTKQRDPSRIVSPASGGNHTRSGDVMDMHHYPNPKRFYLYDPMRVNVLGEYGGIALRENGHTWFADKENWGYVQFQNKQEVTDEYVRYAEELINLARQGYSAGVYTQTTDVEGEVNGVMTYDRKVIKMDEETLRKINKRVIESIQPQQ